MPYNNADWAVVLPQNDNYYRNLEYQERRRLEAERQRKEQDRDNLAMLNMVNNAFDNKDYQTNTNYDQVLHQQLANKRAKYFDMIRNNQLDPATLQYLIQNDMSDVGTAASKVKAMSQGIKNITKDYTKDKGYLPDNIYNLALQNYLYDDKGNFRSANDMVESPDQLVGKVFQSSPSATYDPRTAMDFIEKNYRDHANEYINKVKVGRNGKVDEYDLDYKLLPIHEFVKDAKGNIQFGSDNRPMVRIRQQMEKDQNGREYQTLNDDVWDSFTAGDQGKAIVRSLFNNYNKSLSQGGKEPIKDGTPEARLKQKELLGELLGGFKPIREGVRRVDVVKQNSGSDGSGGKNYTQDFVDRVYNTWHDNNATNAQLIDVINDLKAGNGKEKLVDAFINKDRQIVINYETGETDKDTGLPKRRTYALDPTKNDFKPTLAGIYQRMTGSDAKFEKPYLAPGKGNTTGTTGVSQGKKIADRLRELKRQ